MKKLITTLAGLFFIGMSHAAIDAEIYHGFEKGNPDLSTDWIPMESSRDSEGYLTENDIYHGFERNNPDLSTEWIFTDPAMKGACNISDNDIYHGFERGNPDLSTDWIQLESTIGCSGRLSEKRGPSLRSGSLGEPH